MTALKQTLLLSRWQFRRGSAYLPLTVVVQVFLSVTTVIGYGLLIGEPEPAAALILATGAPTVNLIMVGLILAPQVLAQSRTEGSLDWMRTLPVPRMSFLFSDLLVYTIIALPGMILGVIVGAVRFDITLSLSWLLIPSALLVALTAAAIGYAIAMLLPPAIAQLTTQALLFIVLLFSPVSYTADRLPGWLQGVHEWLPIEPMAQVIRAGLVSDVFTVPARSWVVLLTWCIVCVAGAAAALRKRD